MYLVLYNGTKSNTHEFVDKSNIGGVIEKSKKGKYTIKVFEKQRGRGMEDTWKLIYSTIGKSRWKNFKLK